MTEENKHKIRMTRYGNFRHNGSTYIYGGKCEKCGEYFLTTKNRITPFCSNICSKCDHICLQENKDKISKTLKGRSSPNCKGNVIKFGIALYDTYAERLKIFENVRIYMWLFKGVVYKSLQVRCFETGCKKWFRPTWQQCKHRIQAYNGSTTGDSNFYCSDECKHDCCIFGQKEHYANDITKVARRKILLKKQTPLLTQNEKDRVRNYKALSRIMGLKWHLDHIIPISRGGSGHPNNLQIIPAFHNLKKGDRTNYIVPKELIYKC